MTQPSDPWLIDGSKAGPHVEEQRSWDSLTITWRVAASTFENVHLPLRDAAENFDRVNRADGGYRAVERTDTRDAGKVTLTPPSQSSPPRIKLEAYVASWEATKLEQGQDTREVTISFVPVRNRQFDGGLDQTRAAAEWAFEFPATNSSITTKNVRYDPQSATETAAETATLALVISGSQTETLETSASRLGGVSVREVPDGPNRWEDDSTGQHNAVTVTTPDASAAGEPISDGDWLVVDWTSTWRAKNTYRVELTLGKPYTSIDTSPITQGPSDPTVGAGPTGEPAGPFVDSWEDQDFSEYDLTTGNGTGPYDIVTAGTIDTVQGDYYLRLKEDTSGSEVMSSGGLDRLPRRGAEFTAWMNEVTDSAAAAECYIYWGNADLANCYAIRLDVPGDTLELIEISSDSESVLASAGTLGLTSGAWYQATVQWDDGDAYGGSRGDITVVLEDVNGNSVTSISANSTTYEGEAFGWKANAGAGEFVFIDSVTFHDPDFSYGGLRTTGVIDSWEDEDWGEYGEIQDTTGLDGFAVDGTQTYQGDWAAYSNSTSGAKAISMKNLPLYPRQGDEFELYVYFDGTVGSGSGQLVTYFAAQDGSNHYAVDVQFYNDAVEIQKDGATLASATSLGLTTGGWHRLLVQWDDGATFGGSAGDINVYVYAPDGTQLASPSANDTAYTEGGHGYYHYTESTESIWWDKVEVTNRQVEASTSEQYIDDFEDSDWGEYGYEEGNGTSAIDFISSPVYHGGLAAELSSDQSGVKIVSSDGLEWYPQRGDAWEVWFQIDGDIGTTSTDAEFLHYFGWQDSNNHYFAWYRADTDEMYFYVDDTNTSSSGTLGLGRNTWYRLRVEWDDGSTFGGAKGDFTFTIENAFGKQIAQWTDSDTTYQKGATGWYVVANDTPEYVRWDGARLLNPDARGSDTGLNEVTDGKVDTFEDQDLAEYSGSTGGFQIQPTKVARGDYALEGTTAAIITSRPGDGLSHYPVEGDTFKFHVYLDQEGGQPQVQWCAQDEGTANGLEDGYYVGIDNSNQNLNVWSVSGGTHDRHILASYGEDLSSEWLTVYLEHRTDGSHYVELRDLDESTTYVSDSGTPVDTSFTSGGVKWRKRDAGNQYFDSFRIVDGPSVTETMVDDFETGSFSAYNTVVDDGESVFDFTDPSGGELIGGGYHYPDTVSESSANYTASNQSELESAASNATSGDIVYVTADIDISSKTSAIEFSSGVTLASDRSINGSPGHTIVCGTQDRSLIFNAGCRMTGLQVEGPYPDQWSDNLDHSQNNSEWHQKGVTAAGNNVEIDNCHIYGFGYSNVQCSDMGSGDPDGVHIHHSHIHHGISDGWGYGIEIGDSTNILAEYNIIRHCRHPIACGGGDGSYEFRYNIIEEPNATNLVDMHQMGGDWTDVHHNTLVSWDGDIDGRPDHWDKAYTSSGPISGYIQRENPADRAHIHHNWMWNPHPPPAEPHEGFSYTAIDQAWPETSYEGEWVGVEFNDNQYGSETAAASDRKAPDGRWLHDSASQALVYYGARKRKGMLSTSGLDAYPSAGDTWKFRFRWEGTPHTRGLAQVFFGVQSETSRQNRYELEFRSGEVRLEVDNDGTDTQLLSVSTSLESLKPYEVVVDWPSDPTNNGITITMNDIEAGTQVFSQTATADDSFTSGGFGFYGNSHCGWLLDDVEIVQ